MYNMKAMKLRYENEANAWAEGLPIGNGRMAAIVYGGAEQEIWNITELTYWSGKQEAIKSHSSGKKDIAELRKYFYEGDYESGERLAGEILQPVKMNFGTNLPMCNVIFNYEETGMSIYRELDLEDAIATTSLNGKNGIIHREVFATHKDDLIACRLWSEQSGGVNFSLRLEGHTNEFESWNDSDHTLAFRGQALETVHSDGKCGVRCQGKLVVRNDGGQVIGDSNRINVKGASEVVVYLVVNTDYDHHDESWIERSDNQVNAALKKDFSLIKQDHIADYQSVYQRVDLNLGETDNSNRPTNERVKLFAAGIDDDPQLYALFFQYGRYLTICGARENSPLPLNLQGIWNDDQACRMGWTCDYHLDINTEMNYYPIETTNLSDSHIPLIRYIERLAAAGKSTAKDFYGCDGWVAHTVSNVWGFTAPAWETSWGLNVTGGLWIAMQLRDHYEFTLDEKFLEETAYPVLKDAALFFMDYMDVHPQYGWLVVGPSISPENSFYPADGKRNPRTLSMGSTLDQVLVKDLLDFCLEAAEKLNLDEEFQTRLKTTIALLPPLQIGAKGQVQEWLEDFEEAQPEHRHLSHLHSLYPAYQITPQHTPDLSVAAQKTLEMRKSSEGHEDIEFTVAAFAGCYSRLHDGDRAYEQINHLIGELCYPNLFTYSKPGIAGAESMIYVADGNYGGTAAIADMLLQSHAGEIHFLPALPSKWSEGYFSGLKARGAIEVDVKWLNGKLDKAVIKSALSGSTTLRYNGKVIPFAYTAGSEYHIDSELLVKEVSHK